MLPFPVQNFLGQFSSIAVGGSRAMYAPCFSAGTSFVSYLDGQFSTVFTACSGTGVPSLVRSVVGSAIVFRAVDYSGRAAFPRRAAAMIRAIGAAELGVFVCFPSVPCPSGLVASKRWQSCGSGSWSELSLAVGTGTPCLLFLPSGVSVPSGWGFQLITEEERGSWFSLVPVVIPSLF